MAYVIGITGPSGSGKSTLARALLAVLKSQAPTLVVQDDYYRDLGELTVEQRQAVDFDDPASVELELLAEHLATLRAGRPVDCPVYSFVTHTRVRGQTTRVEPGGVILVEGLLLACREEVRQQLHLLIYVDAPGVERLARRVERDGRERGRSQASVEAQWQHTVEPATRRHLEPVKGAADLVVDGTAPTATTVACILAHLRRDGAFPG